MSGILSIRRPVLFTLLGDWRVLAMLLPLTLVTGVVFVIVQFGRALLLPIDDPALAMAFHGGVGGFLVAALVGAVVATRMYALCGCPFTANLPSFGRRATREVAVIGAAILGLAAGAGPTIADPQGASSLFLPTMAILGYAVGVLSNDPRPGAPRPWQLVPWAMVLTPTFFAPELALLTGSVSWLWLFVAALVAFALLECTGTAAIRRARSAPRPTGFLWLDEEIDVPLSTPAQIDRSMRKAARRAASRAARFRVDGPRLTDWQWVKALHFEHSGASRGGWLGDVFKLMVFLLFLLSLGVLVPGLTSTVEDAGAGSSGAAWSLDLFRSAAPTVRGTVLATCVFATFSAMFVGGSAFRSRHMPLYPLSRQRLAKVIWLLTQSQEVAIFAIGMTMLVAIDVVIGVVSGEFALRQWLAWAPALTAVVIAMPVGHCARVWALGWTGNRARGESETLQQIVVDSIVTVTMILGASGLIILWTTARTWPQAVGTMVAVLSVLAFFAVRLIWLAVLDRHFRTADL